MNHNVTTDVSEESLQAISTLLSNFTEELKAAAPIACVESYNQMKAMIKEDLSSTTKPEVMVNVFSSLLLLVRSFARKEGPDWINLSLVITQFLSTHGIFGSCVEWVISKFMLLRSFFKTKRPEEEEQQNTESEEYVPLPPDAPYSARALNGYDRVCRVNNLERFNTACHVDGLGDIPNEDEDIFLDPEIDVPTAIACLLGMVHVIIF
jgi:hypothetical protein